MLRSSFVVLATCLMALGVVAATASAQKKKQHVHDHGHGKLSVAVDGNVVAFDLDMPADGLYGFEHEPKSAAEKKAFADANAKLTQHPGDVFVLPTDLGCKATKAEVKKEEEKPEPGAKAEPAGTHADINGDFRFECAKSPAGAKIVIAMIKAFPRIKDLKVQINTATNQSEVIVTKPEQEISL